MRHRFYLFISFVLTLVCSAPAQAGLWMPSVFKSGMVLQSGMPAPVWGEAPAGATVTVEFAGQKKKAVADAGGKWMMHLDSMKISSAPREMKISSSTGNHQLSIADVLVGEVWILAGQSNMGWTLANSAGGAEAVQHDYPWLRTFRQWPFQGACDEPARDVTGGQWAVCSAKEVGSLSGVGFFFARALHKSLPEGTPVALINTQMGGTYIESWIDRRTLEKTPAAKPYLEKAAAELSKKESAFPGENNFRRPAALFNGKVAPVQPFAARGVIWYQGEGNSANWLADGYEETLTALITSWRAGWNRNDLPFLIVQLPRFTADQWSRWPEIRAAQAAVAGTLSNVELAVTIDCGFETEIHPPDKEPVGERLALLARAKIYGEKIPCSGPVFESAEIAGESIIVRFKDAGGLYFAGGTAKGFEICGADGVFIPAQAEIFETDSVRIFSPEILTPVRVRYGWFNWGEVSLYNKDGLPAAPFSTKEK